MDKKKPLDIEDLLWHRPRLDYYRKESEHEPKKGKIPRKKKHKENLKNFPDREK